MTRKFIPLLLIVFIFSVVAYAQDSASKLKKADSLFKEKQYTQSFDLYKELFINNMYTPSMLLKMAFIQEGLGHLSLSLYYLNKYANLTHDTETISKINELASKHNLEGYGDSYAKEKIFRFIQENKMQIAFGLVAISVLLLSIILLQKNKKKQSLPMAIVLTVVLGILGWLINFNDSTPMAIIASSNTYLMEGPSAGAPVLTIVNEGHQVAIEGHYDVWRKVKWNGKDAFIKENALLLINSN